MLEGERVFASLLACCLRFFAHLTAIFWQLSVFVAMSVGRAKLVIIIAITNTIKMRLRQLVLLGKQIANVASRHMV